jgi:hypothetical protein
MATRYFQIGKHDRVVIIDGTQFKFKKLSRNHASAGFNGLIELPDGAEADSLSAKGKDFGVWEVTEASAIAEIQKKSLLMNKVVHQRPSSPQDVKAAEVKEESAPAVNSIDDLMSEPEPAPEPAPAKKPATRKSRKSRKSSSK